jgi:holliday junction DNA helicase RuvB
MADALRPTRLQDYLGQDHIKIPLEAAIYSAKKRGQPLAHVLLSGPPGLGKTTLAYIIANEMGWKIEDAIGSTVGNPLALSKRIMGFEPRTIFFIDEIHALRKPTQEVLYPVLEDNRLLFRRGEAVAEFKINPLTVLGATTDLGKLAQPFIDRFQNKFELHFYNKNELMQLGQASAKKLDLDINSVALEVIAERSRGTPRYLNNYLKWMRDFGLFEHTTVIDRDYVESVLWKRLKIDNLGLLPLDRNYLRVLAEANRPVGIDAIASRLRQAQVTLENTVEPFLLMEGMIDRISNGRMITDKGKDHLESLKRRK